MNRDEIKRLAGIASLLSEMLEEASVNPVSQIVPTQEMLVETAKADARARRRRQELFPGIQVADPAWDLMLELFIHSAEGRRISVTGLGLSANVPGATVLRWLAMFQEGGLIQREPDPLDRRRIWVRLSEDGHNRVAQGIAASIANATAPAPVSFGGRQLAA